MSSGSHDAIVFFSFPYSLIEKTNTTNTAERSDWVTEVMLSTRNSATPPFVGQYVNQKSDLKKKIFK